MKKRVLAFAVMLVFAVSALEAQMFSMGVKVGYNVALERGQIFKSGVDQMFDVKGNLQNGFNVGLYSRIGHRLYAQPEVVYKFFTYKADMQNKSGENVRHTYNVSTVDVPVMVGFCLIDDFVKLRVMVGPRFSFNAGSTKASMWNHFNETIRDTRVGLDCGLGLDVWRVNLDIRYVLISDLYKCHDLDGNVLRGNPLNTFELSLGFTLFGRNSKR
ncbi:MAG: outer membrane beta-barrel protein [Candidatus Aphodosoma sp.]